MTASRWALPRAHCEASVPPNCWVKESREESRIIAATKNMQPIACAAVGACYIPPRTIDPSLSIYDRDACKDVRRESVFLMLRADHDEYTKVRRRAAAVSRSPRWALAGYSPPAATHVSGECKLSHLMRHFVSVPFKRERTANFRSPEFAD